MERIFLIVCLCFFSISISLNAQNARYFVSKIYPKGAFELHVFNNYYSQKDILNGSDNYNSRTNFFTSSGQFLYGLNNRINLGLNLRFRSVNQNLQELSPMLEALKFKNESFYSNDNGLVGYSRTGLTSLGLTIKYQPFAGFGNISFQHSLFFPLGSDLGGNNDTGYIDWGNPSWFNQFFYDSMLGDHFSLFIEFALILENMSGAVFKKESGFYQYSTPMTLILNYYPDDHSTFYLLANSAPRWAYTVSDDLAREGKADPYHQFGAGYKIFISKKVQLEFLYTLFYSIEPGRAANTLNLGFRYITQ